MTLHIISEKSNPIFARKEVSAFINSEKSPSREEVIKLLSEKFSSSPDKIRIKKINGKFGSKKFNIEASVYSSAEERSTVELKRKKEGKAPAKAA